MTDWTQRFSHLWLPVALARRQHAPRLVNPRGPRAPVRPVRRGPTRRGVLRGVLGTGLVTVGLPWLEIFAARDAMAADTLYPQRFGVFFWGNGMRPDQWIPESTGTDWELSEELAALAAVKDKISIVSGMAAKVDNTVPHWSGAAGLLTGLPAEGTDDDWNVLGPTLDQIIADEIGDETIYASIEVGIDTDSVFSFTGPNARNPGEEDPYSLFDRIFGATFRQPGEDSEPDPALGYRRSVLDAVMSDIAALEGVVGSADKERLEAHLDGVRDLERRLAKLEEDPPDLEACEMPTTPDESYPDVDGRLQISERSRAMADLLTMALACDQTRVFHFQLSKPVGNLMFPDATDGHHNLTHDEASPQPEVHAITGQIMEELAYLLEKLDSVDEGEGTLLDNSLVLGCSEHGEARTHDIASLPIVLAGSAGGAMQTGVHYRSYTEENCGQVCLSVLRAMGINAASWGEDDTYTEDGLSEIEA